MSTGSPTDLQQFYEFLGVLLSGGQANATPEASVEQFRRRQLELESLRDKLRTAEEQSARGESAPLDAATSIAALRRRLAEREPRQ